MKVTMISKTGKQIVFDAIVEDTETGKPLSYCPPGYYSATISGVAVIGRGGRGANKTPFEQQIVMADFAELEKHARYSLAYGATQEQIAVMLEEISIGYKVELRDYQRQAIKEAKKEPRPNKSKKAKGPRNRWGVVK